MTSKPSATNCPRLSLVWLMFSVVWYCMSCSVENRDGYVIQSLLVAIGHLYLRTVLVLPVQACFLWCAAKETSGGYCGGVPPLPIPNREVKPTCADGTAMQCGRVGSRLLLQTKALRTEMSSGLFRVCREFVSMFMENFCVFVEGFLCICKEYLSYLYRVLFVFVGSFFLVCKEYLSYL